MNTTPLLTLACIGARLELYTDHVLFHRLGWFARIFGSADQKLAINNIRAIHLYRGTLLLNGVLCIIPRPFHGTSIYAVFSRRDCRRAEVFYETLDDLFTRRDVLTYIREHST